MVEAQIFKPWVSFPSTVFKTFANYRKDNGKAFRDACQPFVMLYKRRRSTGGHRR